MFSMHGISNAAMHSRTDYIFFFSGQKKLENFYFFLNLRLEDKLFPDDIRKVKVYDKINRTDMGERVL